MGHAHLNDGAEESAQTGTYGASEALVQRLKGPHLVLTDALRALEIVILDLKAFEIPPVPREDLWKLRLLSGFGGSDRIQQGVDISLVKNVGHGKAVQAEMAVSHLSEQREEGLEPAIERPNRRSILRIMKYRAITLWAVLLLAGVAGAQFGGLGSSTAETSEAGFTDSRQHVRAEIVPSEITLEPGTAGAFAIVMNHDAEWHTWTNPGNIPTGTVEFEYARRTEVSGGVSTSSTLLVPVELIQWPKTESIVADVGDGPATYAVFAGQATIFVPFAVAADAQPGTASLSLNLDFQSCNAATCLQPATITLSAKVNIAAKGSLSIPWSGDPKSFEGFDSSRLEKAAALVSTATSPTRGGPDPTPSTNSSAPAPAAVAPPRDVLGMIILALLSIAGGFVLNLTPCVLPIIPIKILTISQHAGSPGKSLYLGLWMALGVVAFWAGIGIPAALFTSAADPSRIFGIWWLTTAIGVLIGLMGIGIMGLFQIQLPAAAYAVNPKADTAWGSFVFGIMTGVLGLPCFGFVAGALLAGAATLPPLMIVIVFTGIGLGMASPYLILSANPRWVDRIPRTGPASELVKQVMGLLLLAAAAYFVGSGLIALVSDRPWLGRQLHWLIGTTFAVLAGLWLIMRTFQITKKPAARFSMTLLGLLLGGVAVLYCLDTSGKAKETWLAKNAATGHDGSFTPGVWNDYSEEAVAQARASHKIVVLDFTAEWCLTCKTLKAAVLNREPVHTALKQDDVALFTVDLTSNAAPGWETLRSLGKTGIPLLVIYSPDDDIPWMANAYTSDQVMSALSSARPSAVADRRRDN